MQNYTHLYKIQNYREIKCSGIKHQWHRLRKYTSIPLPSFLLYSPLTASLILSQIPGTQSQMLPPSGPAPPAFALSLF